MFEGTTIIGVRIDGKVAMGGDGQVSFGENIIKHGAKKIRYLKDKNALAGFAGSTADAITLFTKFEGKLEQYTGNLKKAAVELAKEWRSDKVLRHLEALLIVMDQEYSLLVSGKGDVLEPDDGILAIGSGGSYALAAARVLKDCTSMDAESVVTKSLEIAAQICVYTNNNITVKSL